MAGRGIFKFQDYSSEKRSFSIPTLVITAANHDAELAKAVALKDAMIDVTYGGNVEYQLVGRQVDTGVGQAADAEGQVEKTWLVQLQYDSDPTIKRSFRIPNAELDSSWMQAGTNLMDLGNTEGAALVTAIEDYIREDGGTGALTVETITFSV